MSDEPITLVTEDGKPVSEARRQRIAHASVALHALTRMERALVLCWFCRGCSRYVGPGDACHCENDE